MRKLVLASVVCAVALAALGGEAKAFVGGGRSPSTGPLISWGQHYIGELSNRAEDANYSGSEQVAFYRLPPVSTHDLLTVNWHALPFTHNNGDFPVRMILAQGLNDYNWGPEFSSAAFDEGHYDLSGSGTAQTTITVGNSDTATYVEFYANATAEEQKDFESYPYDFSVEAPRHFLTLNLPGVETVAANGQLHASVTNAVGQPAPDGLVYTLTANWQNNGVWIGTASSAGGQLSFQLALPEAAWNKSVRFIVSRPPDAEYQAVEAPAIRSKVTTPVAPAPSAACTEDTARAHTLARQRHDLQAHLRQARGRAKHRLRHRLGHVTRAWHVAQAAAKAACP